MVAPHVVLGRRDQPLREILAFTKKSMSKPDETRKSGKGGLKVAKVGDHT